MGINSSRVLITGGAGLIGSFVADQLLKENVGEIIILDNFIRGSRDNLKGALASNKVLLIEGDIRDQALLDNLFQGVDYCFHMAALRINHCIADPRQALEVMFDGTFNVAQACVKHMIKRVVFSSSASIYGMADRFPIREDHHPFNNRTLYGVAKAANEGIFRSFNDMYGLNYIALRYFNVYGPRMDTTGKYTEVLIRWYKLIKDGKPPVIYGDGKRTSDFVYVEDVARANILALKGDVTDEVFNVAEGVETSLDELCLVLLEVLNSKLKPTYIPIPNDRSKNDVVRRLADVSKALELLGFRTTFSLREGLERLVCWLDTEGAKLVET
jgi:UDP-glucose 4-epimerase